MEVQELRDIVKNFLATSVPDAMKRPTLIIWKASLLDKGTSILMDKDMAEDYYECVGILDDAIKQVSGESK
jgi:hypothetical protein